MKKGFQKKIALLLLSVLVVTLLPLHGVLAAEKGNCKTYKVYTCLGDSIPAGYGVDEPDNYGFSYVPTSYPAQLAEMLGISAENLNSCAYSGMRTGDLLWLLEGDLTEEDEERFSFSDPRDVQNGSWTPEQMRTYLIESIAEADLLTLTVGANDILTYTAFNHLLPLLMELMGNSDDLSSLEDLQENTPVLYEMLEKLVSSGKLVKFPAQFVNTAVKCLWEGFEALQNDFPLLIQAIRKINPDADLVVTGVYNMSETLKLYEGDIFTIGKATALITESINTYIQSGCPCAEEYTYVDINGIDTPVHSPLLSENAITDMFLNVHPTTQGNREIAERIFVALPEAEPELSFDDVTPADWYYSALKSAVKAGVMDNGESFAPADTLTRGELAEMLYRLADSPKTAGQISYIDCKGYNRIAIRWVTRNGIMKGVTSRRFAPEKAVSRAEWLSALAQFNRKFKIVSTDELSETISAREAAGWIGIRNLTYRPAGKITRAEAAYSLGKLAEAKA